MVVTSAPSAWTARTQHDFTDSPSTWTVQAPQDDGVAAHVRAGEVEALAEEVDEQLPLLDVRLVADAVDGDGDAPHVVSPLSRPKPNSRLIAPTSAVTASDRPETGFCASSTAAARSSGAADS